MCLLRDFLPDPHDQVNQCSQTDEDPDSGIDTVQDGGGSGSCGADDGWLYILSGFDESAHDYV